MAASDWPGKLQWLNHVMAHPWTPTTLAVLTVLYSYADQDGEGSRPGDERIASIIGRKVRTVEINRAILVDLNVIECTRRATSKGEAAVWRLVPPSEWRSAENKTSAVEVDELPEPDWLDDDEDAEKNADPAEGSKFCHHAVDARWWCEKAPGHRGAHELKHHPRPAAQCG